MTNKLGSSNPNRIPMSKPKMYDKIMEGVDLDELLSEGFQKTLSSDEYQEEIKNIKLGGGFFCGKEKDKKDVTNLIRVV